MPHYQDPGAGKTTLGIEVISRLNRPSLILVPTNTIKNQWKDRICSSFLEETQYDIVSTDIRCPKYITVITYQALLAAFCGNTASNEDTELKEVDTENDISEEPESISLSKRFKQEKADEIIKILKQSNISLLCFDEAHHLRNEWWKALMYLIEHLEPEQTLSLTATPPYDADLSEWQRYENLCGEIDEVISIPELVKNGDLCAHQDFIFLSGLRKNERDIVKKHTENIKKLLNTIENDSTLLNYLCSMGFYINPDKFQEEIYENPEFYVAIVSFLKYRNIKIPKSFLKLFDAKEYQIPKFCTKQFSIFVNGLFFEYRDLFSNIDDKIDSFMSLASDLGLIRNKKVTLFDSLKIERQISGSLGKLDSIITIVDSEIKSLGADLRMVILADFIRANDTENSSLGVIPIWRSLKDKLESNISIGVLCGTIILIPKKILCIFKQTLSDNKFRDDCVNYGEFEGYIRIFPKESCRNSIVSFITEMFNNGDLNILVGTQALLGEGWDAPVINSLILSSTVSSYMLSNQMRGRAIRLDKKNPNKVSNIWHLASFVVVDKSIFNTDDAIDYEAQNDALFHDFNQLSKRFEGFEAPSYFGKHQIESGLSRVFNLNNFIFQTTISKNCENQIKSNNNFMLCLSQNRTQTLQWWKDGLNLDYNSAKMQSKLIKGIESDKFSTKSLCYKSYFEEFLSVLVGAVIVVSQSPFSLWKYEILIICAMLFYIFVRFLKTGTIAGVMKQIAIVILKTLKAHDLIKTNIKKCGLSVEKGLDSIFVSCKNMCTEENNLFIKTLQEFLNPIENPRYLLVKQDKFLGIITQTDYFSIPSVFSNNKKSVDVFINLWYKYIGVCKAVYTRNSQGRKLLLKARKEAFSNSKRKESKQLSKWQ